VFPVDPSPKSHAHDVGAPVEVSVNDTANGAVPLDGDAVKLAVGATAAAVDEGRSARSQPPEAAVALSVHVAVPVAPAVGTER
jgi:hypothetical protein